MHMGDEHNPRTRNLHQMPVRVVLEIQSTDRELRVQHQKELEIGVAVLLRIGCDGVVHHMHPGGNRKHKFTTQTRDTHSKKKTGKYTFPNFAHQK